jgi:hypothetical protein
MAFAGVLRFAAIAGPSDRIRPGGYAPAKRRGAAIRRVTDKTVLCKSSDRGKRALTRLQQCFRKSGANAIGYDADFRC